MAALIGISFLVSGAMLVTATIKPELFMFGAKPARADSAQTHIRKDSTAVADTAHALPGEHAAAESTAVRQVPAAQKAPETKDAGVQGAQTQQTSAAKEEDLQNLVKLYEAMKPEDAAKILGKMPDKEIRTVILHVKKKQAAKILSHFDAARAAQILAQ